MTADYCTWFLKNYKRYEYFGDDALTVRRRIKRLAERPNSPTQIEVVELYQAFCSLYNVDLFAKKEKKRPGIRAKTANLFLLIYMENTIVPYDYVVSKTRVVEKDLQDAVIRERDKKIDYYRDVYDNHKENIERGEMLLDEAKQKFTLAGVEPSITLFYITAFVYLVFGLLLYLPIIQTFFGVTQNSIELPLMQYGVFLSSILWVIFATVSSSKYNYYLNSKDLYKEMRDLSFQLEDNISKLQKFNSKKTRMAIRKSKKIKPLIYEGDYEDELKYFNYSMDLLKLKLTIKNPFISTLYYFCSLVTFFIISMVSYLLFRTYLNNPNNLLHIPIISTTITSFIMIFLLKKVRFWKVFVLCVLIVGIVGGCVALF